ncbi:L,D-transpeptidase family protein [Chlorobium phaeobacteroides]|uniref:Peptidoglycan-binding domain 1 protein n=1 Tax=Chlorobium phaeobacteroides (strain DSM 266 / SMG 266 / 2430) TaxID=290317 RepID=A1BIC0_CHLPD|nr:L,D-transpeptidase family protein [Chlorobium phaeobacteroides]ABL66147.1 Peptidoglycan-binding domain 1 protein [Chlorobium phaeobacteroides DSM 266]
MPFISIITYFLVCLAFSPVKQESRQQLQSDSSAQALQTKKTDLSPVAEQIRCHFEKVQGIAPSDAVRQTFNNRLALFYTAREFKPVWTKQTMAAELISAIDKAEQHGLIPADYHSTEIRYFSENPPLTPQLQARYDLLLSDAFLTLAYHLRFGKVLPESLDPDWNVNRTLAKSALEFRLQQAIAAERIAGLLDELSPRHPGYERMKKGLAHYRVIVKTGGWQKVTEGKKIKEGDRDNRVRQIRRRLQESGDLVFRSADTSRVFSKAMADAVVRFQKRNGLSVDGAAGAETIREMNISAAERIEQIRINMERYRWFIGDLEQRAVLVNIPGFTLQYIDNGQPRWETRVIVGKTGRETPLFKADMQYIVFNPQWVIPPTILAKDALPGIRKSRSYLYSRNLKVIDRNGRVVDPATVNWSQYTAANLPYRLQQTAGDHGSLGRIKFMLPNKHIVYLHDTPHKELFQKSTRNFSSGCIRVQNPLELAELVLQDSVKWNSDAINAAIKTGKTSNVNLPKHIPVYLLYLTAFPQDDAIHFRGDVYNRDNDVLKALNKSLPEFKTESCGL